MGDIASSIVLTQKTLIASDPAALQVRYRYRAPIVPQAVIQTEIGEAAEIAMPTGLSADGDIWTIFLQMNEPTPNQVFYPYAFRAQMINDPADAAFNNLFESTFAWNYSMDPLTAGRSGWQLSGSGGSWELRQDIAIRDWDMNLRAFPVRPRPAGITNRLAALEFTVKTADVAANAATTIEIDFRALAFPAVAADNAGYYMDLLTFHTD